MVVLEVLTSRIIPILSLVWDSLPIQGTSKLDKCTSQWYQPELSRDMLTTDGLVVDSLSCAEGGHYVVSKVWSLFDIAGWTWLLRLMRLRTDWTCKQGRKDPGLPSVFMLDGGNGV